MQTSSANLEELCDAQLCTSVGSSGTTTGDHKTSTMQTNPSILGEEQCTSISMNTIFSQTIRVTEKSLIFEKYSSKMNKDLCSAKHIHCWGFL